MVNHVDYLKYVVKCEKKHGEKTIVLLQVGSFYEVYALKDESKTYGSKIEEFSRMNNLEIGEKNITVQGPIEDIVVENKTYHVVMTGISSRRLNDCVDHMIRQGYTVVTSEVDSQGSFTCCSCKCGNSQ